MKKTSSGFTIVELLIVIVVIAILAAISMVAYNGVQERSRISRAQSDLRNFQQAVIMARINTGTTLREITGSSNSSGSQAASNAAIDKIAVASGVNLNGLKTGDPWGGYYAVDENEGELIGGTICRYDQLRPSSLWSAGIEVPFSLPECM